MIVKKIFKFEENKRPKGVCYDCNLSYHSFPDMVISDELWEKINPTYHKGAGLLCPTCISKRLILISAGPVNAVIYS